MIIKKSVVSHERNCRNDSKVNPSGSRSGSAFLNNLATKSIKGTTAVSSMLVFLLIAAIVLIIIFFLVGRNADFGKSIIQGLFS